MPGRRDFGPAHERMMLNSQLLDRQACCSTIHKDTRCWCGHATCEAAHLQVTKSGFCHVPGFRRPSRVRSLPTGAPRPWHQGWSHRTAMLRRSCPCRRVGTLGSVCNHTSVRLYFAAVLHCACKRPQHPRFSYNGALSSKYTPVPVMCCAVHHTRVQRQQRSR